MSAQPLSWAAVMTQTTKATMTITTYRKVEALTTAEYDPVSSSAPAKTVIFRNRIVALQAKKARKGYRSR
jgi:hypothetical protein